MSKRILLVEDDQDIRANLAELLTMSGFEVMTASDGFHALRLLESEVALPNLILLDLMMPVMDGFEFRRRQLRVSRLANIPVVVMTADANIEAKKEQIPAQAYLRKPVPVRVLINTIAQFIA